MEAIYVPAMELLGSWGKDNLLPLTYIETKKEETLSFG